jgi:hypothetical protein
MLLMLVSKATIFMVDAIHLFVTDGNARGWLKIRDFYKFIPNSKDCTMFMWKYFILYFGVGLIAGISHPNITGNYSRRPIETIFPWLSLVILGLLVWNFASFGAKWGAISLFEVFAGVAIGTILRIETRSNRSRNCNEPSQKVDLTRFGRKSSRKKTSPVGIDVSSLTKFDGDLAICIDDHVPTNRTKKKPNLASKESKEVLNQNHSVQEESVAALSDKILMELSGQLKVFETRSSQVDAHFRDAWSYGYIAGFCEGYLRKTNRHEDLIMPTLNSVLLEVYGGEHSVGKNGEGLLTFMGLIALENQQCFEGQKIGRLEAEAVLDKKELFAIQWVNHVAHTKLNG